MQGALFCCRVYSRWGRYGYRCHLLSTLSAPARHCRCGQIQRYVGGALAQTILSPAANVKTQGERHIMAPIIIQASPVYSYRAIMRLAGCESGRTRADGSARRRTGRPAGARPGAVSYGERVLVSGQPQEASNGRGRQAWTGWPQRPESGPDLHGADGGD